MKKNTSAFKISRISLFVFFVFTFVSFSQDKSIEIPLQFSSIENGNKGNTKSKTHLISYNNTSPFVMLSAYTKDLEFSNAVYYRVKNNNVWGKWIVFNDSHDGETFDRKVYAPAYLESAFESIQFKTDKAAKSKFVFRMFFPEFTNTYESTKNAVTNPTTVSRVFASCLQPVFQDRLDWCPDGTCPKNNSPSTISPTHVVVHHSASDTSSSDYAAVVRGYWDFHVNTNGWNDIGYNWLIDPNGVIYEGRGDRVRGAHSPCMNGTSSGICFIGNYETATPSSAGIQALKDFIAWEATDKGIDIEASSNVTALGSIDHLSGHRTGKDDYPSSNCTATLCPGANLYSQISSIRSSVASYSCYISSNSVPSIPKSFSAIRSGGSSVDIHFSSVDTATSYGVYISTDNLTFSKVTESASTTIPITGLAEGVVYYFKVEAINSNGSSNLSEVVAAIPSSYISQFLIIDGVERRASNANFDAIEQYDYPMTQLGHTFSSATNDAVLNGLVNLSDFKFVIWMLLDESTADETFSSSEQTKVSDFIDADGVFIVSGNELGWDLARGAQSTAADKVFYNTVLKADYVADNPTPLNYIVNDNNSASYNLVQNPNDILDARYPDLIKPINGSVNIFTYSGISSSTGVAGVSSTTAQGGVEYLSFAIESVSNDMQRKSLIEYILSKYSAYLSVDDGYIKQNIVLYPNPSTGIIKISNPNSLKLNNILVLNTYGQLLKNKVSNNNTIDLSRLSNGIYFVKIESETGKQGTYKIIKTD
ncbi:N-acetylmuramoyl-L-alanine amidase [Wocania ichthyoenteri]|uniref:N-acetylmuramoyl-L-alanine amidase n=1 Tax=Wocania ichthyoenteri TaxID=1230531 RepID=UPI00053D63A0|nr:N-acetylmuramoyl-L-alanine amidase [Wocania ichthyoenteri]